MTGPPGGEGAVERVGHDVVGVVATAKAQQDVAIDVAVVVAVDRLEALGWGCGALGFAIDRPLTLESRQEIQS